MLCEQVSIVLAIFFEYFFRVLYILIRCFLVYLGRIVRLLFLAPLLILLCCFARFWIFIAEIVSRFLALRERPVAICVNFAHFPLVANTVN